MTITAQQLIEYPRNIRPHLVLLGAGASKAAFPDGDANGRCVPLMDELVNVVELGQPLEQAGINLTQERNFEVIYSKLKQNPELAHIAQKIELRIDDYFSSLSLPDKATIYDRLLLSLRPANAIFTFNWDPFLFDAYQRNRTAVSLPGIFFLHGNVRIGACSIHDNNWGDKNLCCPDCLQPLTKVPLLYPISKKDYSTNPFIRGNWESATSQFRSAFTITIFGYGAPTSDADAIELLNQAWFEESDREMEHMQIIDIADQSVLHQRWSPFTPTSHYRVIKQFNASRIARWPRRTCESLIYPMSKGVPCEDFPLPETDNLVELQAAAARIAQHEHR